MKRVAKILEKHFKKLWRSRSSIVLIVLIPLIVALLLGLAFNNAEPYAIVVGVFSPSYSALKNSLIDDLAENFKVSKFHSQTDCLNALRNARIHVCIFFPDEVSIVANKAPALTFYVDNTKMNLVGIISDVLSSRFSNSSSKIRYSLTKELVDRLDLTKSELEPFQDTLLLLESNTRAFINSTHDIQKGIEESSISETVEAADSLFSHSASLEEQLQPYFNLQEELDELTDSLDSLQNNLNNYNISSSARQNLDNSLDELGDEIRQLKTTTSATADEAQTEMTYLKNKVESINNRVFSVQMMLNTLSRKNDLLLTDFNCNLVQIDVLDNHAATVLNGISTLSVTNVSTIVTPLRREIKPIVSHQSRFTIIFPTLFVFMIMFTAMLFSSSLIAAEKRSRAFLRNKILPASKGLFLAADMISSTIVVAVQALFFVVISLFFVGAALSFGWLGILVIVSIILLFTLLGLFVGHLFPSEQAHMFASLSGSSVFLFFSNTILPVESMPYLMQRIVHYNPFVIGERLLRKILIHQLDFLAVQQDLLLLVVYMIVILIGVVLVITVKERYF